MKQSPIFSLNLNDFSKGLIMAALTPAMYIIEQAIEKGSFVFNWHSIGIAAATGFMGYIIKNFFSPSQPVQITTTNAQGTVTETAIKTDSVDVNVNQIKTPGK